MAFKSIAKLLIFTALETARKDLTLQIEVFVVHHKHFQRSFLVFACDFMNGKQWSGLGHFHKSKAKIEKISGSASNAITCSKLTIETLEQVVKYDQS